jgi:hypothetical protein
MTEARKKWNFLSLSSNCMSPFFDRILILYSLKLFGIINSDQSTVLKSYSLAIWKQLSFNHFIWKYISAYALQSESSPDVLQ